MPELPLTATRLRGSSEDPDLLIVGPSLGTAVTMLWSRCAHLLDDRFEVVGWDLPGHGRSTPSTQGFSVPDIADAVRGLTQDLRTEGRRCLYAGVSLGGAVGLELALSGWPFEAVAVIASAAKVGEPSAWHQRAALVRREGTSVMVEPSSQRWFSPHFVDRQSDVAAGLLSCLAAADRRSYAAACDALATFDARPRLRNIAVPLLLMPGSADQVVSVAQATETADNAPCAKVHVIDGSGHLPPAEQPAAVAAALLGFFVRDGSRATDHDQ
jgi:3-oxoadipate enol-lactonase